MQHTAGVVVGDHRQVLMPTFVGDLIDTDVEHVLEPVARRDDQRPPGPRRLAPFPTRCAATDRCWSCRCAARAKRSGLPGRGSVAPRDVPTALVRCGPAHRPDSSTRQISASSHSPTRTEIEVPPAATGMVIAGGLASARTSMCSRPWLDRDDDTVAGELDSANSRSSNTQNPIECSADAHVCDASLARCLGRLRT